MATSTRSSPLVGADRVLAILKALALFPRGVGLEELTKAVGSPKPTVHRALAALIRAGLANQDSHGHYSLGDEFIRIAFSHYEARPEEQRVAPVLEALAGRFGETTHYAVLVGEEVVYRWKVDPPDGDVRLRSNVGGRNPAHCTGVGKVLLSSRLRTGADVDAWMSGRSFERRTPYTRQSAEALHRDFQEARRNGYATDDQENQVGVVCIAIPVYLASPSTPSGAISVSALAYRTPLQTLIGSIDEIRGIIGTALLCPSGAVNET